MGIPPAKIVAGRIARLASSSIEDGQGSAAVSLFFANQPGTHLFEVFRDLWKLKEIRKTASWETSLHKAGLTERTIARANDQPMRSNDYDPAAAHLRSVRALVEF